MEKIYLLQSVFEYVDGSRLHLSYITHKAFSTKDDAYDYLDEHGDCIRAYLELVNPNFSHLTVEELDVDDFSCAYCQHDDEEDDGVDATIEELQNRINELEKDIEKLKFSINTDDDPIRRSRRLRRFLDI